MLIFNNDKKFKAGNTIINEAKNIAIGTRVNVAFAETANM